MSGAGCAARQRTSSGPAAAAPGAGTQLAALAAEYWERHLEASPVEATIIGDRRFDDRMPDLSPEGRAREARWLEALRPRVEAVSAEALDGGERITRALLLEQIGADLDLLACELEAWSVDPRDGPQVTYLKLAELQPVKTVEQGRALVARWEKMGPALDQQIQNLRAGLAAGKVATRDEVERVLRQLDGLLARPNSEWPLAAPAGVVHQDWPPAERAAFQAGVQGALARGIRPAFERYRALIRDEILPRARGDARVGVMNVPGGPACYARLIRVHTSLPLPPEEVHEIGLAELDRIRAEMKVVGRQALGTDDVGVLRERLRADASLFFESREDIEAAARAALGRAQAAMPRFLGRLPRTPVLVKAIDRFEEKDSPIAYYRPPAVDGSRPGAYEVNTGEPRTRARYEAEALAFHESVPGHHVQIALAQELEGVPEFRRHLGVTAFVEGWGLYAERLADELGLYSGPLDRLGMLSFDAWRASRLVVDTGLHAKGWSRSQAIAFLRENTVLGENNIENEVDRYIGWPGQALAYKVGQREILRLRAEAERKLGPAFDLRRFHDRLLGAGAVTLGVLGREIESWVAAGGGR